MSDSSPWSASAVHPATVALGLSTDEIRTWTAECQPPRPFVSADLSNDSLPKTKFAADSALEEDGFELPVPP